MLKPESVKINFFKVYRSGFYKHGEDVADFSSFEDILSQLQMWSIGKDLSETKILDAENQDGDSPVYLFGIKKTGASWVLATWNEVPSHESGVASVSMDSKVGKPEVHMNEIKKNSIPGFATYFWAIPGMDILASIRFEGGRSGQISLASYLGKFLELYSKYTLVETDGEGEYRVVGHTNLPDLVPKKVRALFKTKTYQKPNRGKFLQDNVDKIRKVVRRGHASSSKIVDREFWEKALRYLRSSREPNPIVSQKVYVELEYKPTLAELNEMIEIEESDGTTRGWDDMGFVLEGESSPHWLSRESASGEFTLTVERANEEEVNIDTLIEALNANRAELLKLLQ